jgi:hypothetical protein
MNQWVSDIMNYEKAYDGLVKTLDVIFKQHKSCDGKSATLSSSPTPTPSVAATTSATLNGSGVDTKATSPPVNSTSSTSITTSGDTAGSKSGSGGVSDVSGVGVGVSGIKKKGKKHQQRSNVPSQQSIDDAIDYNNGDYHRVMYMSWQRRHRHKPEEVFFAMLRARGGFRIVTRGNRIYEIRRDGC